MANQFTCGTGALQSSGPPTASSLRLSSDSPIVQEWKTAKSRPEEREIAALKRAGRESLAAGPRIRLTLALVLRHILWT